MNPHPAWRQERCELCKQSLPYSLSWRGRYHLVGKDSVDEFVSPCLAPSEDSVIEELTRQVEQLKKDVEYVTEARIQDMRDRMLAWRKREEQWALLDKVAKGEDAIERKVWEMGKRDNLR